jgi:ABC-type transport system involved in multi-copper enzyme maturation permease subunit
LVAATLGLVVAVTAVSSTLAGMLMSGPATPGESWADALESFGRAWVSLLPWVALAASMTVLTGSAAAGTAITMAYQFTEQLLVAVLTQLVDWFHNVADYFLGRNVSAWVQGNDPPGPESFIQGALPSQWHGLLVLLAYTAALSALAFFLFQRRDVKGPSGG